MSTTRLIPLHIGKSQNVGLAASKIIESVSNPEKTNNGQFVTSYGCNGRIADKEFLLAKQRYI